MNRRTFLSGSTAAVMLKLLNSGRIWADQVPADVLKAADKGLEFLKNAQFKDGHFEGANSQYPVAMTGLAGMAFLMEGSTLREGKYSENVRRAVDYLMERARPSGLISNPNNVYETQRYTYAHGFATLFLAEVYGMVNEPALRAKVRETLHDAVQLIISTQNPEGGWRYRPIAADADLAVTICQIMALRAARNAGIAVPKTVADRCVQYVKDCQDLHQSGGFRYQRHGGPPGFARTLVDYAQ